MELTPALPHSAKQRRGWVPPRELAEQHRGVIPRCVSIVACILWCQGIKCPYTGAGARATRVWVPSSEADPARGGS
jgi:hypothetical protein